MESKESSCWGGDEDIGETGVRGLPSSSDDGGENSNGSGGISAPPSSLDGGGENTFDSWNIIITIRRWG